MEFFELNNENEDKVVDRSTRIYADKLVIKNFFDDLTELKEFIIKVNSFNTEIVGLEQYVNDYTGDDIQEFDEYMKAFEFFDLLVGYSIKDFSLTTTSKAKRQKIKFFVDVLETNEIPVAGEPVIGDKKTKLFFKVGKYFELEHEETAYINNTLGYFSINFECQLNNDGSFMWNLKPQNHEKYATTFYISSIVFEDSFYNSTGGWLNPDNPDNLIDLIEDEKVVGLPAGAEPKDFLVFTTEPEWQNGEEVVEYLPLISDEQIGVGKVDNETIFSDSGVIKNKIASAYNADNPDTNQLGVVMVDDTTIKIDEKGVIKAMSGGQLDYIVGEQDTGIKWLDGKTIYRLVTLSPANMGTLATGVSKLLQVDYYPNYNTAFYPKNFLNGSSYAYCELSAGKVIGRWNGYTGCSFVIYYTKV